jgi:hypothetical protein
MNFEELKTQYLAERLKLKAIHDPLMVIADRLDEEAKRLGAEPLFGVIASHLVQAANRLRTWQNNSPSSGLEVLSCLPPSVKKSLDQCYAMQNEVAECREQIPRDYRQGLPEVDAPL